MWPPIFGRILSYYYIPIVIDRNTQILTKSVVCMAEAKKKVVDKLWDVVNSLWNLKIKLGSVRDHWAHIGP